MWRKHDYLESEKRFDFSFPVVMNVQKTLEFQSTEGIPTPPENFKVKTF